MDDPVSKTTRDDSRRSRSRSNGFVHRIKQRAPTWAKEYWIEMLLVVAVLMAIFLLVEQWSIRATLVRWGRNAAEAFVATIGSLGNSVGGFLRGLTLSDGLAILILLGVFLIAGWRVRWRLVRDERFWSTRCPECESVALQRIHRRFSDHVLGRLGFPVRRYRCSDCGWSGRRIYHRRAIRGAGSKSPASTAGAED